MIASAQLGAAAIRLANDWATSQTTIRRFALTHPRVQRRHIVTMVDAELDQRRRSELGGGSTAAG